jgi:hypothetical protein
MSKDERVVSDPEAAGWEFDPATGYWMWKGEEGTGGLWEQNGDDIYYADGKVGIGTDAPTAKLHVDNGGSGDLLNLTGQLGSITSSKFGNTLSFSRQSVNYISALASGASLQMGAQSYVSVETNGSEAMRIDVNGNVGIGTSDPDDKLHVSAGDSGGTSHSYTNLLVESSTHNAIQLLATSSSEQALWFGDNDNSAAGGISYYHPNDTLTFRAGDATHMTIDADGTVKVGELVASDSGHTAGIRFQAASGSAYFGCWGNYPSVMYSKNNQLTPSFYDDVNNSIFNVTSSTLKVDGRTVTRNVDLIKTLSTLRKATMDETQDIRESLRDAIDELVEGFEQEIAAMPAPEPTADTMDIKQ